MTRGWWRKNAAALAIGAVCVPALLGGTWWVSTQDSEFKQVPAAATVSVEASESHELAAARLGPLQAELLPAQPDQQDGADPATTRTYLLGVKVAPGQDPALFDSLTCGASLREAEGQRRVFAAANPLMKLNSEADYKDGCQASAGSPYTAVFVFVVPADAARHTALTLRLGDGSAAEFGLDLP